MNRYKTWPYVFQSGVRFLRPTLQGTNISPKKLDFEDDFPFPKVGHVSSLEGSMLVTVTSILSRFGVVVLNLEARSE